MLSAFYRQYSKVILWLMVLTFPLVAWKAETLPSNNEIETWLPQDSPELVEYRRYREFFGAEEVVVIGLTGESRSPELSSALAGRIERLDGIRECWSPERFVKLLQDYNVDAAEIADRKVGLFASDDGQMSGIVATLNSHGVQHRAELVASIREELDYCQIPISEAHLTGSPVVVTELDRLGNRKNSKKLFLATLAIAFVLLFVILRDAKMAGCILLLTIWSIQVTLALFNVLGGEMNFILGALPVLVMIFTMTICVHFVHYFQQSRHLPEPLNGAFKHTTKPCVLSILTTTIGLASLCISSINPVKWFGMAAAFGSIISLLVGLLVTPAVLCVVTPKHCDETNSVEAWFRRFADFLFANLRTIRLSTFLAILVAACGLHALSAKIDPVSFLPRNSRVLTDYQAVEEKLTGISSIEVLVNFTGQTDTQGDSTSQVSRLDEVRRIQTRLQRHPSVMSAMSAATFLPDNVGENGLEDLSLLQSAAKRDNTFVADNGNLWRISCRVQGSDSDDDRAVIQQLELIADSPLVTLTGQAPLLSGAQSMIFAGFWESFATAFLIISVIMVVALKSLRIGLLSMIPNLTPLCFVFGALGWMGANVDIGMMMTGSIALGIAVDGTFHFLIRYEKLNPASNPLASKQALIDTGQPILIAAVVAACGMLSLTFSPFQPTARFGYMMATLLCAALVGDLILLPAVLAPEPDKNNERPQPRRRQPAELSGADLQFLLNQHNTELALTTDAPCEAAAGPYFAQNVRTSRPRNMSK